MKWVYYFACRPPSVGTHPPGELMDKREAWIPARAGVAGYEARHLLGKVAYAEPLTFEQQWRYDLLAADQVERAEFVFWDEARLTPLRLDDATRVYSVKRPVTEHWLRISYMGAFRSQLEECSDRDRMARAALVLLDAQGKEVHDADV